MLPDRAHQPSCAHAGEPALKISGDPLDCLCLVCISGPVTWHCC